MFEELRAIRMTDLWKDELLEFFTMDITFQFGDPYGRADICSFDQGAQVIISSD